MTAIVIVGAQWGDEGKGKIVDILTEHADLVVRYAGGPNAGHTLVVDGAKLVVRLLPSGILREQTQCLLGQGMVIDPHVLVGEIDELMRRGHAKVEERLHVSDRAHLILPYHILVDGLREDKSAGSSNAIGTTKKGIGPAYEDKARRTGVHAGVLADESRLKKALERALEAWAPTILALGGEMPSVDAMLADLAPLARRVVPLLTDGPALVDTAVQAGQRILLEGAQGTLLDIDHGTYPFVTSSSATAGGATTGAGLGPSRIDAVVGISKAYSTRVGGGPFPTELNAEFGKHLRDVGCEYGSVTGRPRRTGWLDLPALRYARRVNGLDGLALTKLDVLTGLDRVKVCTGYNTPDGWVSDFPLSAIDAGIPVTPVFEELPGWKEPLSATRSLEELPANARDYVEFIEDACGVPLYIVSVGASRDDTIILRDSYAKPASRA